MHTLQNKKTKNGINKWCWLLLIYRAKIILNSFGQQKSNIRKKKEKKKRNARTDPKEHSSEKENSKNSRKKEMKSQFE